MLRAVVLSLVGLLVCAQGSAQAPSSALRARAALAAPSDSGRLARAAAIAGLVTAGLMLSGTLAIELVDQPKSEGITRGIHLGVTALATPLVAWASYSARRHDDSEGGAALRLMGWGLYAGSIALGVSQWYEALNHHSVPSGLGYLYGAMAVLSLLPHCFDAYMASRSARVPNLLVVTPMGLVAKF